MQCSQREEHERRVNRRRFAHAGRLGRPLSNAVSLIELPVDKGASTILMLVSTRKQLLDLYDDMATEINVQFYSDTTDALLKALVE